MCVVGYNNFHIYLVSTILLIMVTTNNDDSMVLNGTQSEPYIQGGVAHLRVRLYIADSLFHCRSIGSG